jgi:hypothetical protein
VAPSRIGLAVLLTSPMSAPPRTASLRAGSVSKEKDWSWKIAQADDAGLVETVVVTVLPVAEEASSPYGATRP